MNKGYYYALISALLVGLGTTVGKLIVAELGVTSSSLFYFGAAFIGVLILQAARKNIGITAFRKYWKPIIAFGALNAAGALLWFASIDIIGPAMTSFLLRFEVVFSIILSSLLFN